ncbi:MAG: NAD(P)H-hydrate epimerase [Phycisphaeraceae bacterium]|nr:NAD(P)H-hydrate epimerase [Phycisphaeraceae bacterium]
MPTNALRVRVRSTSGTPPALAVFDRAGVRAVDRAAIEELDLPGVALMENAAATLAQVSDEMLTARGAPADARALILAGPGNNGGDGFAAARRLRNAGRTVIVATLGEPRDADSDASINLRVLRGLRAPAVEIHAIHARPTRALDAIVDAPGEPMIVIDAMLGTGLDRTLADPFLDAVRWLNALRARRGTLVVAADIPTGLDADTGETLGDAVRADATVTFAGLKAGFLAPGARAFLGEVTVADIGAPRELLDRFGRPVAPGEVERLP